MISEFIEQMKKDYKITVKQQGQFVTAVFTMADQNGLITIALSSLSTDGVERVTVRAIKALDEGLSHQEALEYCNGYNKHSVGPIAFVDGNKLATSLTLTNPSMDSVKGVISQLVCISSVIRDKEI